jgi:hypothetical protein
MNVSAFTNVSNVCFHYDKSRGCLSHDHLLNYRNGFLRRNSRARLPSLPVSLAFEVCDHGIFVPPNRGQHLSLTTMWVTDCLYGADVTGKIRGLRRR